MRMLWRRPEGPVRENHPKPTSLSSPCRWPFLFHNATSTMQHSESRPNVHSLGLAMSEVLKDWGKKRRARRAINLARDGEEVELVFKIPATD